MKNYLEISRPRFAEVTNPLKRIGYSLSNSLEGALDRTNVLWTRRGANLYVRQQEKADEEKAKRIRQKAYEEAQLALVIRRVEEEVIREEEETSKNKGNDDPPSPPMLSTSITNAELMLIQRARDSRITQHPFDLLMTRAKEQSGTLYRKNLSEEEQHLLYGLDGLITYNKNAVHVTIFRKPGAAKRL